MVIANMTARTLLLFGAIAGLAAMAFACSDRKTAGDDEPLDGPITLPYSGEELADRIQKALDGKGAYTISAQQENFVLPQWGGVDGGTVTVGRDDGRITAAASLYRTGDGDYDLWLRNGQTYFKRSTCNDLARVPGGGGPVLSPFVFLGNDRIRGASGLKAATGRTALILTLDGLGETEISFDPRTFLPNQLSSRTATNNGKPLVWTFGDWGVEPRIEPSPSEFSNAYDRGPGGNPC